MLLPLLDRSFSSLSRSPPLPTAACTAFTAKAAAKPHMVPIAALVRTLPVHQSKPKPANKDATIRTATETTMEPAILAIILAFLNVRLCSMGFHGLTVRSRLSVLFGLNRGRLPDRRVDLHAQQHHRRREVNVVACTSRTRKCPTGMAHPSAP